MLRKSMPDVKAAAGTDATVFLYFLHMVRWSLTIIAALTCVVLIPVDLSYSLSHVKTNTQPDAQGNTTSQQNDQDYLLYVTMNQVSGPRLWAHVTLSYLATLIALTFIFLYYRKVIALRQDFFTSVQYQRSYYSRALMITDIPPQYQSDSGLREALTSAHIPYPLSEVQIGRSMNNLPELMHEQKETVMRLESCLNKVLRHKHAKRPLVRVGGHMENLMGGAKVDAIDYYTGELTSIQRDISEARSDKVEGEPMSYGFASFAAIAYAHTVAKALSKKRALGMRIKLASSPRDILWQNLVMSREQRRKNKTLGLVYYALLFCVNLIPLAVVALIANMNAFRDNLTFLRDWQARSQLSFAAVSGLLPPVISMLFALGLPIIMRQIAMYRGVRTRESRDAALCGQYFAFLILTHFLIFSLISVVLDVAVILIVKVRRHEAASQILSELWKPLLERIAKRFQGLSGYWMTWIVLKGYMQLFELAQIYRLVVVWIHKHTALRTPRELFEIARPPFFLYWTYYAELLFLAAIGTVYAPLAPLVVAFVAAVFWMASVVYKYQFLYVYRTKSETGGRLWSIVINRLLVVIGCMQIIIAIVVGLYQSWVEAVSCIPPVLFVIAFRVYCHFKLEPKFMWYTPSAMDLARTKVHVHDADRQRLMRQFGHPFLHEPLLTPIVHASMMNNLSDIYEGPVESSSVLTELDSEGVTSKENDIMLGDIKRDSVISLPFNPSSDANHEMVSDPYQAMMHRQYATTPNDTDNEFDFQPPAPFAKRPSSMMSYDSGFSALAKSDDVPPLRQSTYEYPMPQFVRQGSDNGPQFASDLYSTSPKSSSQHLPLMPSQRDATAQGALQPIPSSLIPSRPTVSPLPPTASATDLIAYYYEDNQSRASLVNPSETPYLADEAPVRINLSPEQNSLEAFPAPHEAGTGAQVDARHDTAPLSPYRPPSEHPE